MPIELEQGSRAAGVSVAEERGGAAHQDRVKLVRLHRELDARRRLREKIAIERFVAEGQLAN